MTERTGPSRASRRATRLALMASAMGGGLAAGALPQAEAQEDTGTVIDDARTAPVLTSVVQDPTISGDDAGITVTNEAALVIDANAVVTQDGAIVVLGEGADVAAVRVTADVTGSYAQAGTIALGADPESVGTVTIGEAPPSFSGGRVGFLLQEGASLSGDVSFAEGASVLVEAADGAAVRVAGRLGGALDLDGLAAVTGADGAAVLIDGTVEGDVSFGASSTLRGTGLGTDGLRLSGQAGRVVFAGTARATGYTDGVSPFFTETAPEPDRAEGETSVDQATLSASGSAVAVTGEASAGLLLSGSTLAVRGAGPALLVGDGARLGLRADDPTTEDDETVLFGLENTGGIDAQGAYDGVSATGIGIGAAAIEGGVRTAGGIEVAASGLDADATGIAVAEGASVARLVNDGLIRVTATSDTGDAVAIRDASGALTRIVNTNGISTRLTDFVVPGETTRVAPTGRAIAIDLSANRSGVEIVNTDRFAPRLDVNGEPVLDENDEPVLDRISVGLIRGDVLTGSGDDRVSSDAGGFAGDVFLGEGDDAFVLRAGSTLFGGLSLGEGFDTVSLVGAGSRITGQVSFGGDAGSLSLTEGAAFAGSFAEAEQAAVTVGPRSSLVLSAGDDASVGSLTTTPAAGDEAGATLAFAVSEDGGDVSTLEVAGDVSLAPDTRVTTRFANAFAGDLDAVLIRTGGTLDADLAALSATLTEDGPFLFEQVLSRGEDDVLRLSLSRKDAAALGIDPGAAPAYEPLIQALVAANEDVTAEDGTLLRRADPALAAELFNVTSQEAFAEAFDQFLPGPLDAPLTYARVQTNSVASLVTARVQSLRQGGRARTAWLQEQSFFVDRGEDEASRGFDGGGFVVALGADTPLGPIDTVGVSASIASARYDEQRGEDLPFDRLVYEGGVYAAHSLGRLQLDGRAAYAVSTSESERVVLIGQTQTESGERRSVTGEWDGTQLSAYGRVSYEASAGEWDVTPFASLDYLHLDEDGYTEEGAPLDRNLALTVEDREATSLRGNAGVILGRTYELRPSRFDTTIPGVIAPRLTAAWSQELDTDELEAGYAFQGGEAFTLTEEKEGGAAIVGADLLYENQYAKLSGGVSGTFGEDVNAYTLRLGLGLKW